MRVLLQVVCVGLTFVNTTVGLENLAQNDVHKGKASQSSVHDRNVWAADKAVDGQLQGQNSEDTCSFTRGQYSKTAWWKFTFPKYFNVAYLQIFFRKSTINRHTGFNVFVFNESSYVPPSTDGYKVFTQDASTCPTQVMNVTVNRVTKGIALFNSRNTSINTSCTGYEPSFATIEICEVMVMGCHFQNYGESCTPCSPKCLNQECDAFNGSCIYGCSNRFFEPPDCAICKSGYYGQICERTCGKCKTGTTCNSITGICSNGCQEHWNGSKCDVCKNGFYGDNCTQLCGYCKPGTYCHNITGTCHEGCNDHWNGSQCNVCKNGFYGTNCKNPCGICANGMICDNITGICPHGCQQHWNGSKCNECDDGYYGSSCNETCGYCMQNICTKEKGHCLTGCKGNLKGVRCEELISPLERSTGGIIGGIITSLTIVIVVVVCTVIIVRRRNLKKEMIDKRSPTVISDVECDQKKERNPSNFSGHSHEPSPEVPSVDFAGDCVYYNTNQLSCDIKIEDLQNCIATKSASEKSLFLLEYKRLPSGDIYTCHTALKKENITKNRFKTTFPYEHSRVILQEKWNKDDNDYINANYIRDLNGEMRFIATQGPQKNTITDFWRMIWQENIECVLMLTNLVENGKNKCKKYWPNKDRPLNIGPCKVSLLEETSYAFYTFRKFSTQRESIMVLQRRSLFSSFTEL